ncbi:MAG: hypothetical protein AB2L26_04175 [Ignavibacteria bacterium]
MKNHNFYIDIITIALEYEKEFISSNEMQIELTKKGYNMSDGLYQRACYWFLKNNFYNEICYDNNKYETKFLLSSQAYFSYLQYLYLDETRKESKEMFDKSMEQSNKAFKLSKLAFYVSIALIIIQILIMIYQICIGN